MAKKKSPQKPPSNGGPMDVGLLEEIVKLMSANDLNTVDLRDGVKRVILRRGPVVGPMQYAVGPQAMLAPGAMHHAAPAPASVGAASVPAADDDAGLVAIKSPMVGTFYSSPKPGAKSFVTVGSAVAKDETDVCIIEAMKTFNVHKSEITGTIVRTLIQDGQSVQFDQPLFMVKPV